MLTFSSPGGTFWCSLQSWQRLARLAAEHGWAPTGIPRPVSEPDSEDWAAFLPHDASVDSPDSPDSPEPWYARGVVIPDEDARALADALEAALPDIPRFDALAEKTVARLDLPATIPIKLLRPGVKVSNYEFFSGANRQALERFISLCRAGSVVVS